MENHSHNLKTRTLCFDSYKNRELNIKLWWIGAQEKKVVW